jgi:hypothetical protein
VGKSAGTNKTVATTNPPSFQQPYIDQMLGESKRLYEADGPQFFPGSTVANLTDGQIQANNVLTDKAVQNTQFQDDWLQPAMKTALTAYDVKNNPYIQESAQAAIRPVMQQLTEQVLPNVRSGAVASGALGGSRQGIAEAQGMERAARAALDTTSQMYGNAYQQGMNTLSTTIGQMPAIQSMAYQPGQVMAGIGDQQQKLDQAKINEEVARWTYGQQLPYTKLAEYGSAISRPFGGQATSEVTATGNGVNQSIGAGLTGIAALLELWKLFKGTP